jgi:hypothetical protein
MLSPAAAEVRDPERLMPLGPGTPNAAVRPALARLTPDGLFDEPVRRLDFAQACLAGLWLLHDFIDESHNISQELSGRDGSYWHAILHRREGDFGNSKYWLRRVGDHPIFADLAAAARKLADDAPAPARFLGDHRSWDPFAFVDLCERAVRDGGELETLCRMIQKAEWDLLFDHDAREAVRSA